MGTKKYLSLSGLKPFKNEFTNGMPYMPKNPLTAGYMEMVLNHKPYYFFITFTFGKSIRVPECCKLLNRFFDNYNQKLFGRKYFDRDDCIDGFVFFEDHKSTESRNKYHVHILVKAHVHYEKTPTFGEHMDKFYKAASMTRDDWKKPVFEPDAINIKHVYDDNIAGYCLKEIWDKNISRIKFITKEGLLDNDEDNFGGRKY